MLKNKWEKVIIEGYMTVTDGGITLAKPFRHKTLEERASEYNGRLMLDGEYDFGEPVGREVW